MSGNKDDTFNVPELSYLQLFIRFLWFGARAFGGKHKCSGCYSTYFISVVLLTIFLGPVAQISMMKTELVTEEKWISNERFNRLDIASFCIRSPNLA